MVRPEIKKNNRECPGVREAKLTPIARSINAEEKNKQKLWR
jgi:hypothetical protein